MRYGFTKASDSKWNIRRFSSFLDRFSMAKKEKKPNFLQFFIDFCQRLTDNYVMHREDHL